MNYSIKSHLFILVVIFVSCTQVKQSFVSVEDVFSQNKKMPLNKEELQDWHYKDIIHDTIPGISLDRAYAELLPDKKGKEVIVAIVDTEIDIYHEDLKENIWTNPKEMPGNGKDDDNNGYVDDIHGWNFLGNSKGENIIYQNYEFVRIIKKFREVFQSKSVHDIPRKQSESFSKFLRAEKIYEKTLKAALKDQKYGNFLVDTYPKSKKLLKEEFYPDEDYTVEELDSLYNFYKDKDKEKSRLIYYMADYIKYNLTQKWISTYKKNADAKIEKILNLNYNDREIVGDNPEDINDTNYGNNNISRNAEKLYHGTVVTGVIAANRNNGTGIKGIAEKVRIMPLCISSNGDEHDKDIVLAIRYAVDNGARVINMSFRKDFSLHEEWVLEAIKYAAQKDVVLIVAAGNEGLDIDNKSSYPNDTYDQTEVAENFIVAGASSFNTDENLMTYFSNYGKNNVDVFAPGEQIYTTYANNDYKYDTGTSMAAPIVSGIAALIRSYYPKLSAAEVKDIIMQSGVSYNMMVNVPGTEGKEQKPFSEFSKSGKVVNAYNALLMAERVAGEK